MEDNNNYTYTYRREKKKEIQRTRIIIIAIYAVLAVFCIIFGVLFGNRSAVKARENELSSQQAEESTTEEVTTEEPSPYKPGEYAVNTEGYSLKFRKDHTTNSDVYLEISDGTKLTVEEIFHDTAAVSSGSDIDYWGKITYKGYTGWVAMNYLKKAYSENIVTPDDITTTEESTTQAPVTTTEAPVSTTQAPTEPSNTEEAPSESATAEQTTAAPKYTAGEYIVSTGGYTLTFRKTASKDGETILSIEDGTKLVVTKIVETSNENEALRYWGEVTYKGHTGYVSMAYLKKAS